jgi:hypothetical protein
VNTNQRPEHLQVHFLPAAPIAEKNAITLFFCAKTSGSIIGQMGFNRDETRT